MGLAVFLMKNRFIYALHFKSYVKGEVVVIPSGKLIK